MKFAVGDTVQLIKAETDLGRLHVGWVGEIIEVGPFPKGHRWGMRYTDRQVDYLVLFSNGEDGSMCEHQIRKLPGDSIPASTLAIFATKQPNPDKVKEKQIG